MSRALTGCLSLLGLTALAPSLMLAAGSALAPDTPVRGWTILSDNAAGDREVIAAASSYHLNQMQLSQRLVNRLKDLRGDEKKLGLLNELTDLAHAAGIQEVAAWDNTIYSVEYYPEKFRTGPNGTIDLDNPEFWAWFKADYRALLDQIPNINAIVVQVMESGGNIISQSSKKMPEDAQKIAALVNAIADVVINERHMNLYTRIYPNDRPDNPHISEMVNLLDPRVRLLIKVTPLDYFLTVPNSAFIGALPRPTVVEFCPASEYGGDAIVAGALVDDHVRRWRELSHRPNVIGFSARTDLFLESRLVGRPGEINLYALKRAGEDPNLTSEEIYDEFITAHYGAAAVPEVKAAFKNSFDIVTSTFYTLGTPINHNSKVEYETYTPPYMELCAGRWNNPPIGFVGHDVNREFHYWRDVINHLAPAFVKDPKYEIDTIRSVEMRAGGVGLFYGTANTQTKAYYPSDAAANRKWLTSGEAMDETYLRYILTEKNYGVKLAEDSLHHIENAKASLRPEDYEQLYHYFNRTLITARLWKAATASYFGFRVWCRGAEFQTPYVNETVQKGLTELKQLATVIRDYPVKPWKGQWDWSEESKNADLYFKLIAVDGWPKMGEQGIPNPNGGMKFPYKTP